MFSKNSVGLSICATRRAFGCKPDRIARQQVGKRELQLDVARIDQHRRRGFRIEDILDLLQQAAHVVAARIENARYRPVHEENGLGAGFDNQPTFEESLDIVDFHLGSEVLDSPGPTIAGQGGSGAFRERLAAVAAELFICRNHGSAIVALDFRSGQPFAAASTKSGTGLVGGVAFGTFGLK